MSLSHAIRRLFDHFLIIPGRAYPEPRPVIAYRWHDRRNFSQEHKPPIDLSAGLLMYQDGTACSASHFYADVYYFPQRHQQPWLVLMDVSGNAGHCCPTDEGTPYVWCEHLGAVFMELVRGSFHDPTSAGELYQQLGGQIQSYLREDSTSPTLDLNQRYYERDVALSRKIDALTWTPNHWNKPEESQ